MSTASFSSACISITFDFAYYSSFSRSIFSFCLFISIKFSSYLCASFCSNSFICAYKFWSCSCNILFSSFNSCTSLERSWSTSFSTLRSISFSADFLIASSFEGISFSSYIFALAASLRSFFLRRYRASFSFLDFLSFFWMGFSLRLIFLL